MRSGSDKKCIHNIHTKKSIYFKQSNSKSMTNKSLTKRCKNKEENNRKSKMTKDNVNKIHRQRHTNKKKNKFAIKTAKCCEAEMKIVF